jgi:hypothetical protein
VDSDTVSEYPYSVDQRNIRRTWSQPAGLARATAPRLAPWQELIVIVLSSLGLWGVIWLAVSSLASFILF